MEGVDLQIEDDVYDLIVEKAFAYKLGARGLRSICEEMLSDAMFEIPSQTDVKTFVLTKEYAQNTFEKFSKIHQLEDAI